MATCTRCKNEGVERVIQVVNPKDGKRHYFCPACLHEVKEILENLETGKIEITSFAPVPPKRTDRPLN